MIWKLCKEPDKLKVYESIKITKTLLIKWIHGNIATEKFLGIPFNIASYALLTHLIAHEYGLGVGAFVHTLGDAHIYPNHIEQVEIQLAREPRVLPKLKINPNVKSIFDVEMADLKIE